MKTANSLSGGKTSAYIAVKYPADYDIFALVTTTDKKCQFPDKKLRQEVSDRIGHDFVGTLEENLIIYTMLDLEQYIGRKITWVAGKPFDEIIIRKTKDGKRKKYLPNVTQRFCTSEMKLDPMFRWWQKTSSEVMEMRIGFRANEQNRAKTMLDKTNSDGYSEYKTIIGKSKSGSRNRWGSIPWQKPVFPLIKEGIFKDQIEMFWKDKPVRFAYMNNCIGCFHRNPILLRHMSNRHPNKFEWFASQERDSGYGKRGFKNGMTYDKIKNSKKQIELFDDDFQECDGGYCGL